MWATLLMVVVVVSTLAPAARGSIMGTIGWYMLGYDEHCTYTRDDAIQCFAKYLDTNHDGVIDLAELEAAKQKYVGWAMKLIEKVVSWEINISTALIMKNCGAGTKGYFTPDDFRRSAKSCMPSREAMCMVKAVCDKADKEQRDAFEEVKNPRVKTWWNKWV